ncbi:MAG: aminotransferase class I/II-fold pyridoxal phosphate-dependent enzyme [Deltaproteobacteria bacterium]|jgi:1-aminocyclopropane-1-carboxylate synthase|nr:aminotransferase class I/II-fold pyridoxal phosphate-dependent enzyme [Deltaproteobacteria bacterium]
MQPYLVEHIRRTTASGELRDSYRCLAVAENKLMWDLLDEQANVVRNVGPAAFGYAEHWGSQRLRSAISDFGKARLWRRRIDPDSMVVMAGAGASLEALFNAVCEPGEGVLVPTPSYSGYWLDLETRIGVGVVQVPTSPGESWRLTIADLEAALDAHDGAVAAILLTTPSNPTGLTIGGQDLREITAWARSHGLHVVVNELYALSTFDPDRFESAATILDAPSEDVHLVWGFSKDFSSSGLRCGVVATANESVIASMRQHAMFSVVSGDTQHLLTTMLEDADWLDRYLTTMRGRLHAAYRASIDVVSSHGFGYTPADGGLFVFADLRSALREPTWEGEDAMWWRIIDETGVNLTPGSACRSPEPGFMRICHATEPTDRLIDALDRALSVVDR